ncbi:hypothetical protein PGT21_029725 [Puccinia graminis f. sp. tritici]|uniref:Uncharacterized protein n=1 Tax=Puccinia graminis f. sp. tritici TaxID=56615 RepID=A0A5B0Q7L1_PUCGR|nr:hypothetical protein PGT21_029725 [Puccinia graminis f. sp. tritici]
MVNRPKLKLQLAVAIAKTYGSKVEIDGCLDRLRNWPLSESEKQLKSLIIPKENGIQSPVSKPTGTRSRSHSECAENEPTEENAVTGSQLHTETSSTNEQSENISSQPKHKVLNSGEIGPADEATSTWVAENKHLKQMNELQRQEIINLRHELAERWHGLNRNIEPEVKAGLHVQKKRPLSMLEMIVEHEEKKKQKKESAKAKKTVRFGDQREEALSATGMPSEIPSDKISSSAGDSTFDTLSRIIRLNELLRSSSSEPPPSIQTDLLTLEAIREAAVGLLTTLRHSLQETSRMVFGKQRVTDSSIPRATHLIARSISSALAPLFLPEHPTIPNSSKAEVIKRNWSKIILPFIYQNLESLFEEIMSTVTRCCQRLEEYFWDDRRSKTTVTSFEVDNMMVLREELSKLAQNIIRQSSGWTGDFQFHMIKTLLGKMESIYFTDTTSSGHKVCDLEALAILAELLETVSKNLAQSTMAEINLVEIRAIIAKIVCNHQFGIGLSHSPMMDRKFDRVLMRFWVL